MNALSQKKKAKPNVNHFLLKLLYSSMESIT